jgi:hypothetical protein
VFPSSSACGGGQGQGMSRHETEIDEQVEGVYVPGVSRTVRRGWSLVWRMLRTPRIAGASHGGVHDRAWVEVLRGCRGAVASARRNVVSACEETSTETVMAMPGAQLDASGHQELALASLPPLTIRGWNPPPRSGGRATRGPAGAAFTKGG